MKKTTPKSRFWLILAAFNILAFTYPVALILRSDDDSARVFGLLVLLVGFIFLLVADALSIMFAYWA